jgi:PAS domain-containing protein
MGGRADFHPANDEGVVTHYLGVIQDITERRKCDVN